MGRMSGPPVVVVAPIGPNPAPLTELLWALVRQRGLTVAHVVVVVDREAHGFLVDEVLAPGEALDDLRRVLGDAVPDRLEVRTATLPSGALLDDDDHPEAASAYNAAVWSAARHAVALAGPRPVVFGVLGGRRRTLTVMASTVAQLLARPGDLCLDVRVSRRAAEGGSGFFFPEQRRQRIPTRRGELVAREVEVKLVDLQLPRLGGLLTEADLSTWQAALSAGQRGIDAAAPPRLTIDLHAGRAKIDERPLKLSPGALVWLAVLAHARVEGEGWVAASDDRPWARLGRRLGEPEWLERGRSEALRRALASEGVDMQDLGSTRSRARKALLDWCSAQSPSLARWLVPERDSRKHDGAKATFQRLPLPGDHIDLRWPSD